MICDRCKKRITNKLDENWQRFDISDTEYTLCQGCFDWLVKSIEKRDDK